MIDEGIAALDVVVEVRERALVEEFPKVFEKAGGFHAVIGNPPYIRVQTMTEWAPLEVGLYKKYYQTAAQGNYDIYVVFVERSLKLLNEDGLLGFILPHKFFNAQYGEALRKKIATGRHLIKLIHFGDQQVFHGATTYTCLLFLSKMGSPSFEFHRVRNLQEWRTNKAAETGKIPANSISDQEWNFSLGTEGKVLDKIRAAGAPLGQLVSHIAQGIRTSANEVYVLDVVKEEESSYVARSEQLGKEVKVEKAFASRFLQGRDIKPYHVAWSDKIVIIPYRVSNGGLNLIGEKELQRTAPATYQYLVENKAVLEARERNRMKGSGWHGFVYPKNIEVMKRPKILVPDIAARASFALDEKGEFTFTSGYGIILKREIQESPKYILGLLNSKVLDFFLKKVSTALRGGFFRYFSQYVEQLPIRRLDLTRKEERAAHDGVVGLVDQTLRLRAQRHHVRTDHGKNLLDRQLQSALNEIDKLAYALYGLSKEEVAEVEKQTPLYERP